MNKDFAFKRSEKEKYTLRDKVAILLALALFIAVITFGVDIALTAFEPETPEIIDKIKSHTVIGMIVLWFSSLFIYGIATPTLRVKIRQMI